MTYQETRPFYERFTKGRRASSTKDGVLIYRIFTRNQIFQGHDYRIVQLGEMGSMTFLLSSRSPLSNDKLCMKNRLFWPPGKERFGLLCKHTCKYVNYVGCPSNRITLYHCTKSVSQRRFRTTVDLSIFQQIVSGGTMYAPNTNRELPTCQSTIGDSRYLL
jgi:hypothetical protein